MRDSSIVSLTLISLSSTLCWKKSRKKSAIESSVAWVFQNRFFALDGVASVTIMLSIYAGTILLNSLASAHLSSIWA